MHKFSAQPIAKWLEEGTVDTISNVTTSCMLHKMLRILTQFKATYFPSGENMVCTLTPNPPSPSEKQKHKMNIFLLAYNNIVGYCWILLDMFGYCWILLDMFGYCWILSRVESMYFIDARYVSNSSTLHNFKCSNTIKIRDGRMFGFYLGMSHICILVAYMYFKQYHYLRRICGVALWSPTCTGRPACFPWVERSFLVED